MKLSEKSKKFLLNLAFNSIKSYLEKKDIYKSIPKIPEDIKDELYQKAGVFVSVYINEKLNGCIGIIEPIQEIYKGVILNALEAAFKDPRFPPLQKDQLPFLKIEISILTPYKEVKKDEIIPGKHGVIIQHGPFKATFLPQVWEHYKTKEEFLSYLALKAGIPPSFIDDGQTKFYIYEAEVFNGKYPFSYE